MANSINTVHNGKADECSTIEYAIAFMHPDWFYLCSQGLQDISCISDCMGLLHLDLAKNNISNLKDLGRFRTLHMQYIYCQTFHKWVLLRCENCLGEVSALWEVNNLHLAFVFVPMGDVKFQKLSASRGLTVHIYEKCPVDLQK